MVIYLLLQEPGLVGPAWVGQRETGHQPSYIYLELLALPYLGNEAQHQHRHSTQEQDVNQPQFRTIVQPGPLYF